MKDATADDGRDQIGLTDADYVRLQDHLYQKTGILLDKSKRYFVRKRIERRMIATGQSSFRAYFALLRLEASQQELQALVNEMTVNETYFFREAHQFDALVQYVLPEISARRRGAPIRIWCVPCSTGEEPYSVAIYLMDRWSGLANHDVELIGSDIDTRVLADARKGQFSARSVHYISEQQRRRYFRQTGSETFVLNDDLRQVVDFTRVNVLATPPRFQQADIDVVFCRNLLIYFDLAGQKTAVENIYEALRPGGYVFLGHSESMGRISNIYRVRRFGTGFVYQKPEEG